MRHIPLEARALHAAEWVVVWCRDHYTNLLLIFLSDQKGHLIWRYWPDHDQYNINIIVRWPEVIFSGANLWHRDYLKARMPGAVPIIQYSNSWWSSQFFQRAEIKFCIIQLDIDGMNYLLWVVYFTFCWLVAFICK